MKPLPDLPELRIVDTASLQPHEDIDPARMAPLKRALERDRELRNPPIVLPLSQDAETYLVLDGANRTTAFRELGFAHMLVQVVHFGAESLKLTTWNRVILGTNPTALFEAIAAKTETLPLPGERKERLEAVAAGDRLAYLSLPDGSGWALGCEHERLLARVEHLQRLLAAIEDLGYSERTGEVEAGSLIETYPELAGLLAFPAFEIEEVIEVANAGLCLPSGLTRFIVSPRALRVNFPIERLATSLDRDQKQHELEAWIQEKLRGRQVRYYAESTFLFDE